MNPTASLETTVLSYLAARPDRSLIRAAHQRLTRMWWETKRSEFDLYVSQIVIQEISAGNPTAAADRLTLAEDIPALDVGTEAELLGEGLLRGIPLPTKAALDALHIAIAAVNGMDYLLTWNCRHIANATLRSRIETLCQTGGYSSPLICTPEELLGLESDVI